MPQTDSPLRYPGGKAKLYRFIAPIIDNNLEGLNRTYIEPFAGGAGLALKLLYNDKVNKIVLNDKDSSIFAFWHACLNDADKLCDMVENCQIDIGTWDAQKEIYLNPENHTTLDVGFATFFLNRCNVSGVIRGGPIGGRDQCGVYPLDARFNKIELIRKIQNVNKNRERISVFNQDARSFMLETLPSLNLEDLILNIDPPYVKKGPMLYENSFSAPDHKALAEVIQSIPYKWITTYDECELIYSLFSDYRKEVITLNYSAGSTKHGKELMIYSDNINLDFPQIA